MSERKPLEGSILLRELNGDGQRKLIIHSVLAKGTGSSVICYDADHEGMGRGVLKEFYPERCTHALRRNGEGQLVGTGEDGDIGFYDLFLAEKERFLKPYGILLKIKHSHSDGELTNFIPAFELYEGCAADGTPCGTVYVWSPQPALTTFHSVLQGMHQTLSDRPEDRLYLVLRIMHRLTGCVCHLHREQLIHRDINPNNFGFQTHYDHVLAETLTFFDVDTVSYLYDEDHSVVGTPGYIEPRAGLLPLDARTDIYSVGATLFSAVVITEETRRKGQRYDDRYYNRLKKMVAESELIQTSDKNASPEIRRILVRILRRCLAPRRNRYQCCEELLADLDTALETCRLIALSESPASRMRLIDRETERAKTCSCLNMLYHFYRYPLYKDTDDRDELRVLLLGFGGYGWKYLDACLQMGQMIRKPLRVTVDCENYDLFRHYLSRRPALMDFFDVDGMCSCGSDDKVYGHIQYIPEDLYDVRSGVRVPDRQKIRSLLENIRPHRVFISLDNDAMNCTVADYCADASGCRVCFVSTDDEAEQSTDRCVPVSVNAQFRGSGEYPALERMAFNAHLIWEKDWFAVNDDMIGDFRRQYYSGSSFSNVLSMKYKLHLAGVDLDAPGMTPERAAELYLKNIRGRDGSPVRDELIWTEHRRWVTEKICDCEDGDVGWQCMKDFKQCPVGDTKYRKGRVKLHSCLVHSRPDSALEKTVSRCPEKWDTMTREEYESLDELDRVSVDLHRRYRQMADEILTQTLQSDTFLSPIRIIAGKDLNVLTAYQEWYTCVKDIEAGKCKRIERYDKLRVHMLDEAKKRLPADVKKIENELAAFNELFLPVLESYRFLNLKNNDADLVDGIPFILTYDRKLELVIPYVSGSFSALFENVAAATVINPAQITYLYAAENEQALASLRITFPRIVRYIRKKKLRARLSLMLFLSNDLFRRRGELKTGIADRSEGLLPVSQITCYRLEEKGVTMPQRIADYLHSRADRHAVALQYFDTAHNGIAGILRGGGVYDTVEHFAFDTGRQTFTHVSPRCAVKYLQPNTAVSVSDMMAFGLSLSNTGDQPGFYRDYQHLWNRYQQNPKSWKALCRMLGDYDDEHSTIVEFCPHPRGILAYACYHLPITCLDSVRQILDTLLRYGLIEAGSKVERVSDYCEITVKDVQNHQDVFDELFLTHSDKLTSASKIVCFPRKTRNSTSVIVREDNLIVSSFAYSSGYESFYSQYEDLLRYWEKHRYIFGLRLEQRISFHYASHSIKKLLTNGGRMLEVFVYHKLREQAELDDVVSGCKINWGDSFRTLNELDCVVTKGFRSVFVECKSTDLQAEYYYKLDSLVRTLGVNAVPVIISDDCGRTSEELLRRGDDMNILTITDMAEIQDIGNTLLDLLKES